MKKIIATSTKIITCLCLSAASLIVHAQVLTPYTAIYSAKFNGMNLTATRTLTQLADHSYLFTSHAKNFMGSIQENSRFNVADDDHIRPLEHSMQHSIFGIKKAEKTVFDWSAKTASYTSKKKQRSTALKEHSLDFIGYQIQLAVDLQAGQDQFNYEVIRHGKPKTYQFKHLGFETLTTPLGAIDTVKLIRIREDNERTTEFWMAPSLNYLVVKFRQTEDSEEYNLQLQRVDFNPDSKH